MKSITIRPRKFDLSWKDKLVEYFERKGLSYVIGLEKGKGQNINHLQIYCNWDATTSNVRRDIKKVINFVPEDDMEARVWLKVAETKDPKFTIGYCLKEGLYASNLPQETLDDALEYSKARDNKVPRDWISTSINTLLPKLFDWAKENDVVVFSLRALTATLVAKDLMPLSLAMKVNNKKTELFWEVYKMSRDTDKDIFDVTEYGDYIVKKMDE